MRAERGCCLAQLVVPRPPLLRAPERPLLIDVEQMEHFCSIAELTVLVSRRRSLPRLHLHTPSRMEHFFTFAPKAAVRLFARRYFLAGH